MAGHEASAAEKELDQHIHSILREVIQKSNDCSAKDEVSRALLYFLSRVANTWHSIKTLRENSPGEKMFMLDAAALLRVMLDACYQAEYITHDADEIDKYASDYLNYEHVERYKMQKKTLGHDNQIASQLKSSAKRPEGEKRARKKFDQVKGRYLKAKRRSDGTLKLGPGTRDKWYSDSLRDIAEKIGRVAEYDTFVTNFNGCTHSSALAVQSGSGMSAHYVVTLASMIACRVARLNTQHNSIDLGDFYGPIMDARHQQGSFRE